MKSNSWFRLVAKSCFTLMMFLMITVVGFSQPTGGGEGDPDQAVPFDDGVLILVAAAVGYGIKRLYTGYRVSKKRRIAQTV